MQSLSYLGTDQGPQRSLRPTNARTVCEDSSLYLAHKRRREARSPIQQFRDELNLAIMFFDIRLRQIKRARRKQTIKILWEKLKARTSR